jgi:hypothetical protein
MKLRALRCALAVVIVLISARPAHADMMGFWRWWESLSGPGPFNGLVVELSTSTIKRDGVHADPDGSIFLDSPASIRMGFQFGVLKAEDNPLDYGGRTPPGVWAIPIAVNFDRNIAKGFDVGAGIGLVRFTGDDFGLWRTIVSPRLSVAPVSLASRERSRKSEAFKIRFFYTWLIGELDAADFGAIGDFEGGNELLFGTTFTVDVLTLLRR